jgi:hypothetical protein
MRGGGAERADAEGTRHPGMLAAVHDVGAPQVSRGVRQSSTASVHGPKWAGAGSGQGAGAQVLGWAASHKLDDPDRQIDIWPEPADRQEQLTATTTSGPSDLSGGVQERRRHPARRACRHAIRRPAGSPRTWRGGAKTRCQALHPGVGPRDGAPVRGVRASRAAAGVDEVYAAPPPPPPLSTPPERATGPGPRPVLSDETALCRCASLLERSCTQVWRIVWRLPASHVDVSKSHV